MLYRLSDESFEKITLFERDKEPYKNICILLARTIGITLSNVPVQLYRIVVWNGRHRKWHSWNIHCIFISCEWVSPLLSQQIELRRGMEFRSDPLRPLDPRVSTVIWTLHRAVNMRCCPACPLSSPFLIGNPCCLVVLNSVQRKRKSQDWVIDLETLRAVLYGGRT